LLQVTLQIQLSQCQDRMLELEKELENPYDEKRVRRLGGEDPSPAEIQTKIEDVSLHFHLLDFLIFLFFFL
jgi:hypothetical protein